MFGPGNINSLTKQVRRSRGIHVITAERIILIFRNIHADAIAGLSSNIYTVRFSVCIFPSKEKDGTELAPDLTTVGALVIYNKK